MAAEKKMTHKAAEYRGASTASRQRCGTCSMYLPRKPPACTLVERPIHPDWVCKYYESNGRKRAA